jgi:transcriptional regulator with GAF, ATPase, and Fis domain
VVFSKSPELDFAHLGGLPDTLPAAWRNPAWRLPNEGFSIDQAIDDLVTCALRDTDHNVAAAARRLGVTREFLRYRLKNQKEPD